MRATVKCTVKCTALIDNQNAGCRARGDRSDRLTNDRVMGGEDEFLNLVPWSIRTSIIMKHLFKKLKSLPLAYCTITIRLSLLLQFLEQDQKINHAY